MPLAIASQARFLSVLRTASWKYSSCHSIM
uniref:Uncharacterized protein n=1 Tax=Arundo donax TaxID=35708 RepID=A0A0A9FRT7_ARUDO